MVEECVEFGLLQLRNVYFYQADVKKTRHLTVRPFVRRHCQLERVTV